MRTSAIFLILLSTPVFVGCGSGVTVETDSPVDILEKVEVGGVTVQAPEEIQVGDVRIETGDDGRVTAQ